MPSDDDWLALHRYFLQSNQMRTHYDPRLVRDRAASVDDEKWTEQWIDLSLWYGCLYVVIEGWQRLGAADPEIDGLLASQHVALLKRFRNGVFHYQRRYWDNRFSDFVVQGAESAAWARQLNAAIGRYFLEWFRSRHGVDDA